MEAPTRVRVSLPAHANEHVTIEDKASDVAVRFALQGASGAALAKANGLSLYREAFEGSDILHRVTAEGTEDFVAFEAPPAREELVYEIDVSRVDGLRFVGNNLEFLDADGTPRLRIAPPWVADTHGKRTDASLRVEGCAYDASPAAPWGRPITKPGASTCIVHVSWHGASYPLLVDPAFTSTGAMSVPRFSHTAVMLSTGKVLILAGASGSAARATDLYDPATATFAASSTMAERGKAFTATALPNGDVLVTGGYGTDGALTSAEIYHPPTGLFYRTGSMTAERAAHTATLLNTGQVLLTGGGLPSAELYQPIGGRFSATGAMGRSRTYHSATLLASGKVLILGGSGTSGTGESAEVYDPEAGTFAPTGTLTDARCDHTATLLPSGKVIVAGGARFCGSSQYLATTELYDPIKGVFAKGTGLGYARFAGTATLLPSGKVLFTGGTHSSLDVEKRAELYEPAKPGIAFTASMAGGRYDHTATLLPSGKVLVTGGITESGAVTFPLASAELFAGLANGGTCAGPSDCDSGQCVDGVCCNTECKEQCKACDVDGHVGTCSPASGTPHGARAACAGTGTCGGTCDGQSAVCAYPPETTSCGSTCSEGFVTEKACDGKGACILQGSRSCNSLVCADGEQCKAACSVDADCLTGFACKSGKCERGGTCLNEREALPPGGQAQDCQPYRCVAGACKTECGSSADCLSPNVCNAGHCGPEPGTSLPETSNTSSAESSSDGCSVSSRERGRGFDFGWLIVGAALFVRLRPRRARASA